MMFNLTIENMSKVTGGIKYLFVIKNLEEGWVVIRYKYRNNRKHSAHIFPDVYDTYEEAKEGLRMTVNAEGGTEEYLGAFIATVE